MSENPTYSIPYPRNVFKRTLLKRVLKFVLWVLASVEVSGLENIPKDGPLILAGNHVGSIETALMAIYSPRLVEFLAAGDLPLDPQTQFASDNYGFIAVNRGNLDRKSVRMALDVLAQDGVLGIFPEGGTWEPARMPAQIGVALLSQRGNAPVVPLGMSGIYGALGQALKLKRPIMKLRFGKPIPPFTSDRTGQDLKKELHQHADFVLKAIYDLIDEADKARYPVRVEHTLSYLGVDETAEQSELNHLEGGDDLARMLMSDVILETFSLNLKMPVTAFYPSEKPVVRADFLTALHSILELLKQNPGFLSYRYGSEVADRQVAAIQALIGLLGTNQPLKLSLTSVATFKDGHQETTKRIYQISLD
jgi:1-acyl-sn-glycerol-3-phosphate acyltransferase